MKTSQYTIEHIEYATVRSFDEVTQALEAATGDVSNGVFDAELSLTDDSAELERRMERYEGRSGFMRFMTLDHGGLLTKFGVPTRGKVFMIGNPLVALTLLEHSPEAALSIPVRILVRESGDGTVSVSYERPSSLLSRIDSPRLQAAAEKLDSKLEAFVTDITGNPPKQL